MIKLQNKYIWALFIFIIHEVLGGLPSQYINTLQDTTLNYRKTISESTFIDLENILGQLSPLQTKLESKSSCSIQSASFTVTENLLFEGSFFNNDIPFMFKNNYFVIRVDTKTQRIYLMPYTTSISGTNSKSLVSPDEKHEYLKGEETHPEILGIRFLRNIALFATQSDLLIFNFASLAKPALIGIFPLHKNPFYSFEVFDDSTLFLAGGNAVVAYDIFDIEKKNINTLATFTSYLLPDGQTLDITEIKAMCACQDVLFIGDKKLILVVPKTDESLVNQKVLVRRVITSASDILQLKRVGRSLIVLSSDEVIEYIFINDCLDLELNMQVSLSRLGFETPVSNRESINDDVDLVGSDKGKYFAVINNQKRLVYFFESTTIPVPNQENNPIFTYHSTNSIELIDLYEYIDSGVSGIKMVIKEGNNNLLRTVVLQRNPLGLVCSSWLGKGESVLVQSNTKFCHSTLYNYTSFVEETLKPKNVAYYNDTFYFDPNLPCIKRVIMDLTYEWSYKVLIALICIILAATMGAVFIIRFLYKKIKSRKHQFSHKKFHNKKNSNAKVEISSLSIESDRKDNDDGLEKNENEDGIEG